MRPDQPIPPFDPTPVTVTKPTLYFIQTTVEHLFVVPVVTGRALFQ
jgi:hypothetical protein